MKLLQSTALFAIGLLVGLLVSMAFPADKVAPGELGAQALRGTLTAATTTVGTVATEVVAGGANLQRFIATNHGPGAVWCTWGSVSSTLNTGLPILPPQTTTTLQQVDITDPFLLGKRMTCVATEATDIAVLKWTN